MKYNKTIWNSNTVITPQIFNNIEDTLEACVNELNKVGEWAKSPHKPVYTAEEVGAEQRGAVKLHNLSGNSHPDLHNSVFVPNTTSSNEDDIKKTISSMKRTITTLSKKVKELEDRVNSIENLEGTN